MCRERERRAGRNLENEALQAVQAGRWWEVQKAKSVPVQQKRGEEEEGEMKGRPLQVVVKEEAGSIGERGMRPGRE